MKPGNEIYKFASKIFPYHRHLMGSGVRETLKEIKRIIPKLKIHEVKSGHKCFDWKIPLEWNIQEAFIQEISSGKKIIDLKNNNLHILQYSTSIKKIISKKDLLKKLHYNKKLPNAIPYRTSYYKKDWGFCIKYKDLKKFNKGKYRVVINSNFFKGSMSYGELYLSGKIKKEIFLTTYICHPSMANNEVSGPSLLTYLAKSILNNKKRYFSYRIIFIPETIGSIYYISKNIKKLKNNVIFGINLSCVGDDGKPSIVKSLNENTLADKIFLNIFKFEKSYNLYNYLDDRGSDERQFNLPNVNLPIVNFSKSKFNTFKEYHTSLDNLKFISKNGFQHSYDIINQALKICENNKVYKCLSTVEPFFENKLSTEYLKKYLTNEYIIKEDYIFMLLINIIALCNGKRDLIDISNILNTRFEIIYQFTMYLVKIKSIKIISKTK